MGMTEPTMPAAVYRRRGEIEVAEIDTPAPDGDHVLVEVDYCGICGTDLHMVLDGWGRPDSIGGHEFSGRIAARGVEVSEWQLGDAVVAGPVPGCGSCETCRAGRPGLCLERPPAGVSEFQGAFAGYVRVEERQLFRVPAALSLREAALTEPLAEVLRELGSTHCMVVHGSDGLDELTLAGTTRVSELKDGTVRTYDVDPAALGFAYCKSESMRGGRRPPALAPVVDAENIICRLFRLRRELLGSSKRTILFGVAVPVLFG